MIGINSWSLSAAAGVEHPELNQWRRKASFGSVSGVQLDLLEKSDPPDAENRERRHVDEFMMFNLIHQLITDPPET